MLQSVCQSRRQTRLSAVVCCCLLIICGCGPMVMLGKMLQGDPMVEDEFKKWNGKSLAKSGKEVAILCSTPESIKTEYAALDVEILSEMSRKLATKEISVIKPYKVARWIDDHGWENLDLKELGTDLGADYIIQVKLDSFDFREENSPNLFRGRTSGVIAAYEMKREQKSKIKSALGIDKDKSKTKKDSKDDSEKKSKSDESKSKKSSDKDDADDEEKRGPVIGVKQVYNRTFQNVYPTHQPVSIEQMQPETFKKKFIDHVSEDLSKLFYAHKAGSGF